MKVLLLLSLLFISIQTHAAKDLEFIFGHTFTMYDDHKDYNTNGLSARFKYNLYNNGKGFTIFANFPGNSIDNFDVMLGYGIRSGGRWFFEGAGGVFYSRFFGKGIGVILSTGIKLGKYYISLPLVIREMGLSYRQFSPMIGWTF